MFKATKRLHYHKELRVDRARYYHFHATVKSIANPMGGGEVCDLSSTVPYLTPGITKEPGPSPQTQVNKHRPGRGEGNYNNCYPACYPSVSNLLAGKVGWIII